MKIPGRAVPGAATAPAGGDAIIAGGAVGALMRFAADASASLDWRVLFGLAARGLPRPSRYPFMNRPARNSSSSAPAMTATAVTTIVPTSMVFIVKQEP